MIIKPRGILSQRWRTLITADSEAVGRSEGGTERTADVAHGPTQSAQDRPGC